MSWECLDEVGFDTKTYNRTVQQTAQSRPSVQPRHCGSRVPEKKLRSVAEQVGTTTQLTLQPPVLEKLKDKIITAGPHIDIIETRLRALEKRDLAKGKAITQLQQERDRGLASKAKLQQKTLLGQIAYTISDILEEFVFGEEVSSSFLPISISDFANNNMQLTEQQHALAE